jgi:hypothetical protein
MNNKSFLLISWIVFMNPPIIESAVCEFNVDGSYFDSSEIRNPFLSQLPKKEEPKPPAPVAADLPQKPAIPVPSPIQPVLQSGRGEQKPPPPAEIPLPALNITGLIWDTDRPQAIVNSRIVDVGDTILGARIIAIKKTGVDVLFNGKNFSIGP